MKHIKYYALIAIFPFLEGICSFMMQRFYILSQNPNSEFNFVYYGYILIFFKIMIGVIAVYWLYLLKKVNTKTTRRILLANAIIGVIIILVALYYTRSMQISNDYSIYNNPSQLQTKLYELMRRCYELCFDSGYAMFCMLGLAFYFVLRKNSKQIVCEPFTATVEAPIETQPIPEDDFLIKKEDIQVITSIQATTPSQETQYVSPTPMRLPDENEIEHDEWKPKASS